MLWSSLRPTRPCSRADVLVLPASTAVRRRLDSKTFLPVVRSSCRTAAVSSAGFRHHARACPPASAATNRSRAYLGLAVCHQASRVVSNQAVSRRDKQDLAGVVENPATTGSADISILAGRPRLRPQERRVSGPYSVSRIPTVSRVLV